jgi:hypothetical protein
VEIKNINDSIAMKSKASKIFSKFWQKYRKTICITAAAFVGLIFYIVAVVRFNTISLGNIPPSFAGAALGALITGIITLVLLRGQSAAQEVKERNVAIFMKKRKVFQQYIDKIWSAWTIDKNISDNDFADLCNEYYTKVAMFLKKATNEKCADHLIKLGNCVIHTANYDMLKEHIFGIVNVLVEDLGLDGYVDLEQHNDLEKTLFPGLFKKALEKEIFKALRSVYPGFLPGKYEELNELGGVEWLSFCFPVETQLRCSNDNAKIIIGPFKADTFQKDMVPGDICVGLFIGKPIIKLLPGIAPYTSEEADRNYKNFLRRIIMLVKGDHRGIIPIHVPLWNEFLSREEDEEDNDGVFCLNFGAHEDDLRKKHQGDYIQVAKTIAYRAAKVVQLGKPTRTDVGDLSIIDFLVEQGVIPPVS